MLRFALALIIAIFAIDLVHSQGGMGPGPGTVHSAGGGSPTITITGSSAQNGGFGSLGSFSMAVGSYNASTDDLIFFAGADFAYTSTAPTIGGVLATVGTQNADNQTSVYYIPKGSGVTASGGNVTVTPAGTYASVAFVIGYASNTTSSTPTSSVTTAFTFFASPNQINGTVASGGVGAVFWHNTTPSNLPITWLPSGWARVAASEASQTGGNGSQSSAALQGTPASGSYTFDSQITAGAYAFIAFQ